MSRSDASRTVAPVTEQTAVLTTLYKSDRLDLLEIALQSLEGQSGLEGNPPRIYLCCDGPLPEGHDTWLEANAHRFHRILRNACNIGLAQSLNNLIEVLEDEEFVFRMDGDDISHPDRFRSQIAYMKAHPDMGLIGCQAWDIDDEGTITGEHNFPISAEECARATRAINPILHPTFCLRRKVLRDPRNRYPVAFLTEDLAFVVTLQGNGVRMGNCPERLFSWRLGASFFARRQSWKRGVTELVWYSRAVRTRYGLVSPYYIYPFARFSLRLMPSGLQKRLYASKIRSGVMAKSDKKVAG